MEIGNSRRQQPGKQRPSVPLSQQASGEAICGNMHPQSSLINFFFNIYYCCYCCYFCCCYSDCSIIIVAVIVDIFGVVILVKCLNIIFLLLLMIFIVLDIDCCTRYFRRFAQQQELAQYCMQLVAIAEQQVAAATPQ